MYWLLETEEQWKQFSLQNFREVFLEIIPYNYNIHPSQNLICAFYIKPISRDITHKGYIATISHSEAMSVNIGAILRYMRTIDVVRARNKKEILHYFASKNIVDLTLKKPYIPTYTNAHKFFYKKYPNKEDINCIIPIVKHYEYCEKIFEDLESNINLPHNIFFNNEASIVFNAIERNGIKIDKEEFSKRFYPTEDDFIYTQYNFKTLTSRPSNTFKGVNFAALNRENGDRKIIIPRNDYLLEMDISAYHPTLLSKLIGYKFKTNNIHQELGEMYGVDYNKSKHITFQQLYGGIFPQYKHLDFFKKTQSLIDELWDKFTKMGYIECPISSYPFYNKELKNMNPPKLLNYLLQAYETSLNIKVLWDVLKLLRGKNTKLILYTYDSILLDVDKNEEEILEKIRKVFSKHELNIKEKKGLNYNEIN